MTERQFTLPPDAILDGMSSLACAANDPEYWRELVETADECFVSGTFINEEGVLQEIAPEELARLRAVRVLLNLEPEELVELYNNSTVSLAELSE